MRKPRFLISFDGSPMPRAEEIKGLVMTPG
jgi:hypothetical protein